MTIEINGKKYGFNTDVRLGILELMEKENTLSVKQLKMILKELLLPRPTPKEFFGFRASDSNKIFIAYTNFVAENSSEIKKKLSS